MGMGGALASLNFIPMLVARHPETSGASALPRGTQRSRAMKGCLPRIVVHAFIIGRKLRPVLGGRWEENDMKVLLEGGSAEVAAARDALVEDSRRKWGAEARVESPPDGGETRADPVMAGIAVAALVVGLPAAIEKVVTLLDRRKKTDQADDQKRAIEALKQKYPRLRITIIEIGEDEEGR